MPSLRLTEIWIYPIKSLGGIRLSSSKIVEKGLPLDRRWMLVDDQGVFMTQRVFAKMALFKPELSSNKLVVTYQDSFISIPIEQQGSGEVMKAIVWDDTVDVTEVDPAVSQWFSTRMAAPCRLVVFPEQNARLVDPRFRIKEENVSLADAYPFLIIGQESLNDLNNRLKVPLPMNRFRPNFVFEGGIPFEEDGWREFRIGGNRFVGVKPCARCAVPTINQDTAEKGIEPLATLAKFRKKDAKVFFGQNVIAIDHYEINEGDEIVVG